MEWIGAGRPLPWLSLFELLEPLLEPLRIGIEVLGRLVQLQASRPRGVDGWRGVC